MQGWAETPKAKEAKHRAEEEAKTLTEAVCPKPETRNLKPSIRNPNLKTLAITLPDITAWNLQSQSVLTAIASNSLQNCRKFSRYCPFLEKNRCFSREKWPLSWFQKRSTARRKRLRASLKWAAPRNQTFVSVYSLLLSSLELRVAKDYEP